jgi:hypothetical protein
MTQPALDFAAPVSVYTTHRAEVQAEQQRLERAEDRVLRALQAGPKTNVDLVAIGGIRATGRISDLRAQGHIIHADHVRGGIWCYVYRGGPR